MSRLNYELQKAWKNTGMADTYGTVNRKRIATIMAWDHPEKQEITAKVLKHLKNHRKSVL